MRHRPLLSFFVLASALSWIAWAPLVAGGLGWTTVRFTPYLHLVGGLGPLFAAVIVTTACGGRAGLARLIQRCVTVRGRLGWFAFAVLAPVLLFAISAVLLVVAGGQGQVALADVGRSVEYPGLGRAGYWVANIVFYGVGEEVGGEVSRFPGCRRGARGWPPPFSSVLPGRPGTFRSLPLPAGCPRWVSVASRAGCSPSSPDRS